MNIRKGILIFVADKQAIKMSLFPSPNIIEVLRKSVIDDLFSTGTVNANWPQWSSSIKTILENTPTPDKILSIGDKLADIFKQTGSAGRDQGELSGGGAGWEALITWYLNLCCANSRVVAIKKMGSVPAPIRDSITVNYSNFSCSTESDITVIVFPDLPQYTEANDSFLKRNGQPDIEALSNAIATDFSRFQVGIVQCKTNWNDNAQIPMLWDMIYSAGGFKGRQISVGKNGFSIQALEDFTYSFVTVPTNKLSSYTTTCLAVKRVINLSGGNYWGQKTANGISRSIKEIFQNYNKGFENRSVRQSLSTAIPLINFADFHL